MAYQDSSAEAEKKYMIEYISRSEQDTIEIGRRIGKLLQRGDVLALIGELGCGKTWFTKGLALGLGVDEKIIITSPTFILVNEYEGMYKFYHIDLYRIRGPEDALSAGIDEYINRGDGVVAIEWADLCPEILPQDYLNIRLNIVDQTTRSIQISGHGDRSMDLSQKIKNLTEEL